MKTQLREPDYAAMIANENGWQCWPFLPMKNPGVRDSSGWPKLGYMLAGNGQKLKVYEGLILLATENDPFTEYPSIAAILAAGWVVD